MDFLFSVTLLPLMFSPIIFWISIFPVISIILGLGVFRGKGSLWGVFTGFTVSFVIFRLLISLLAKVSDIGPATLQFIGMAFLILIGLLMLLRTKFVWNSAFIYSFILGFLWSFWVGLSKAVFSDYYEPEWIGPLEVYITVVSSIVPGIILVAIAYLLSKIYPNAFIERIERALGILTLFIAVLLPFHLVFVAPREELKPKEPPPQTLSEIFNLKNDGK